MLMITRFKDSIIRRLARTWLLKKIDGHKKEIGRILLGVQMIVFSIVALFPDSAIALELEVFVNEIFIIVAWLGLEFGIQDEEIKIKEGKK